METDNIRFGQNMINKALLNRHAHQETYLQYHLKSELKIDSVKKLFMILIRVALIFNELSTNLSEQCDFAASMK